MLWQRRDFYYETWGINKYILWDDWSGDVVATDPAPMSDTLLADVRMNTTNSGAVYWHSP